MTGAAVERPVDVILDETLRLADFIAGPGTRYDDVAWCVQVTGRYLGHVLHAYLDPELGGADVSPYVLAVGLAASSVNVVARHDRTLRQVLEDNPSAVRTGPAEAAVITLSHDIRFTEPAGDGRLAVAALARAVQHLAELMWPAPTPNDEQTRVDAIVAVCQQAAANAVQFARVAAHGTAGQ